MENNNHYMENNNQKGCVYFFKHNNMSPIKIGYSSNESPSNRFDQFKTYAPFGGVIIGFIRSDKPKELESKLHERFKSFRLAGEWFGISEETARNIISFYSSNEDKEFIYKVQELASGLLNEEVYQDEKDWINIISSIIQYDRKSYNNEFRSLCESKLNDSFSNRFILNKVSLYCLKFNLELKRGRDNTGRYFYISKLK
tara:strand:+ start:270 stop:866 length:597 start_codon:yes stop_codon:yes gene_type:complete